MCHFQTKMKLPSCRLVYQPSIAPETEFHIDNNSKCRGYCNTIDVWWDLLFLIAVVKVAKASSKGQCEKTWHMPAETTKIVLSTNDSVIVASTAVTWNVWPWAWNVKVGVALFDVPWKSLFECCPLLTPELLYHLSGRNVLVIWKNLEKFPSKSLRNYLFIMCLVNIFSLNF